ncbi:MAG TPA: hypothetical protein PL072_00985 [Phycisphaerales bacterium]|nr:hypothetical protein [Phycisphaerales bacterium]
MPYRPFIDPLTIHDSWYWLLIPMALGIALVYKAVRLQTLEKYWRQVAIMTTQIVIGMILLGAASYLIVVAYVRFIAERIAGG